MTVRLNIFGERYDDSEPCFLMTGTELLYNRVSDKWISWASLSAFATSKGYTFTMYELGIPSIHWQQVNMPGYIWSPGTADTSGFASNAIINGEDWVGAIGTVAPTNWDPTGGAVLDFSVADGNLTMENNGVNLSGIWQDVSGLQPFETYVVEIQEAEGNSPGMVIDIGYDQPVRITTGGEGKIAFAHTPSLASETIIVFTPPNGKMVVDYIRMYLASDLFPYPAPTGSGDEEPEPAPEPDILGPFSVGGQHLFWVDKKAKKIGFNLDDDAEADLWATWNKVRKSDISDDRKDYIKSILVDLGVIAG